MKIFQTVRKHYAIMGISSPSDQSASEIVLLGFLIFGCSFASQFMYIFRVASGFMEYMECVSSLSAGGIIFVSFAAIVFRKRTLFESIDNIEKLVDSSKADFVFFEFNLKNNNSCVRFLGCKFPKPRTFFFKTNAKIERLSKIVFTVVVKIIVQFVMVPKCIVSFAVYLTTDAGSDSFELPIPMW